MGRRHGNKSPVKKTTWAISLDLDKLVARHKSRHDTLDEFVRKVFEQWLEWRDTISFYEEAYEKQSKVVQGYVKQIRELKQQQKLTPTEDIIANK